jgi:sirohydrochlorin cobaltochelatase
LLIGHGTRDSAGLAELREVARRLAAASPQVLVQHCFLELAEPTIAAGILRCVEQGVRQLTVQPLLLFAAGHAKRDIPEEVDRAARQYPLLQLRVSQPLGCHPKLLDLSELRYAEALASFPGVPDGETLLLLVGRGSRDPETNSEMARFSRLRWERRELGWVETCFTAMTWPSLADGLAAAATLAKRRIVVQPHLLFAGELLSRVQQEAAAAARRHPEKQWVLAPHLGPHALLIDALVDLSTSAV